MRENERQASSYMTQLRECMAFNYKELENTKKWSLIIKKISVLITAIGMAGCVVWFVGRSWLGILLMALAVLTLPFLGIHLWFYKEQKRRRKVTIQIYQRYESRINGEWKTFSATGAEYSHMQTDQKTKLFGEGSLYQLICVAHTPGGKKRLAQVLAQTDISPEELEQRRGAVAELAEQSDPFIYLEASGYMYEQEWKTKGIDKQKWEAGMKFMKTDIVNPTWLYFFSLLYLSGLGIVGIGSTIGHWGIGWIVAYMLFGILLSCILRPQLRNRVREIYECCVGVDYLENILNLIAARCFQDEYLQKLQWVIKEDPPNSPMDFKEHRGPNLMDLCMWNTVYRWTKKPMVYGLLSGLCMIDLCLLGFAVQWIHRCSDCMTDLIEVCEEFEMLSSLAVIRRIDGNCDLEMEFLYD